MGTETVAAEGAGATRLGNLHLPGARLERVGSVASSVVLRLRAPTYARMVALAYDGLPEEACGLLAGDPAGGVVEVFYPCRNLASSSRVYTIDPRDHLRAERDAEERGLEVMGVMHSHTHTDAYPSPTDVAQAPDPSWHYVIVSLRDDAPVLRSYRIVEGTIGEEPVGVLR